MLRACFPVLARAALGLVAPPCCAACEAPLADDGLFCPACEIPNAAVHERLFGGIVALALGAYEGSLGEAVRRLKYGSRPDLARPIAHRMAEMIRGSELASPALLVPVPLHPKKLAARGYNQSALVASHLSRSLGWPTSARALRRTRETRQQASLARSERLTNMTSAFVARVAVGGAHIVLVDDVVTTGATSLACAHALIDGGAASVAIAAIARALS